VETATRTIAKREMKEYLKIFFMFLLQKIKVLGGYYPIYLYGSQAGIR
jgi:hypothetical protein